MPPLSLVLSLALLLQAADAARGPTFAELAAGAAVLAVISLLTWVAVSMMALVRRMDRMDQTLFGPEGVDQTATRSGVIAQLAHTREVQHRHHGWFQAFALDLGLELREDGSARPDGLDGPVPFERRLHTRRAEDRARDRDRDRADR